MSITTIRAEIGSTGDVESIECDSDFHAAIAEAVELEHCCDDTSGCDIARAMDDGYPIWAAQLLQGATETPLLDAVISHYCESGAISDWRALADAERTEWLESDTWTKHAHKCESCGSYTFGDEHWTPDQCENCLAPLSIDEEN